MLIYRGPWTIHGGMAGLGLVRAAAAATHLPLLASAPRNRPFDLSALHSSWASIASGDPPSPYPARACDGFAVNFDELQNTANPSCKVMTAIFLAHLAVTL